MFIVFYYIPFNDENEIEGTWNEFNFLFFLCMAFVDLDKRCGLVKASVYVTNINRKLRII